MTFFDAITTKDEQRGIEHGGPRPHSYPRIDSRKLLRGLLAALPAIALALMPDRAAALGVTQNPVGKTQGFNYIAVAAGSTVTISVPVNNVPLGAACPCPPVGVPTFTWNLYDADNGFREQGAVDFTEADATAPPNVVFTPGCPPSGWVCRLIPARTPVIQGSHDYTYTGLPPLTLSAHDFFDSPPDACVEVVATLGTQQQKNDQCTPDLPSVSQGDLGVQQPPGSLGLQANITGLATYPIRAFSRGYDEIWDLLDAGSGVDPGIFLSSESFSGSLPSSVDIGSLLLLSAPATGRVCADEPASSASPALSASFFNLNTGEPGSGVATDEYYFVRENDTGIEYSAIGDIDMTVNFFDLNDLTGRAVTALAVGDMGVRGVFETDDHIIYAYEGSPVLWVLTGPLGTPTILSANGHTFDGTAAFDFTHFGEDGVPGPVVTPTGSITSISIASNIANIQPVPSDRVYPDYDHVPPPAFFDDFGGGSLSLFVDIVASFFDFENDASAVGGQREVHIDVASTTGNGVFAMTSNGVFTHDQADETAARSEVIWDGTDASPGMEGAGSLSLDLEAHATNAMVIEIQRIENYSQETPLPSVGAFVELDEPGRPRTEVMVPFAGPIVANESLILPYHLFGPDLTDIAAVGLLIDGTSNADFVADISRVTATEVNTYPPFVDAFEVTQISISRSVIGSEFAFHRSPITMTGEVEVSAEVLLSENIANLDVTVGEGLLIWSQGMSVLAEGSIVWDGMDGSASTEIASAVNLVSQNADALELTVDSLTFDAGVAGGVGLSFAMVSRLNPSKTFVSPSVQLMSPIAETQTIVVPYTDFTGSPPPSQSELAEVSSLSLHIDGGSQTDFSLMLGELSTTAVPEPRGATMLFFGAGALALLARSRTRA